VWLDRETRGGGERLAVADRALLDANVRAPALDVAGRFGARLVVARGEVVVCFHQHAVTAVTTDQQDAVSQKGGAVGARILLARLKAHLASGHVRSLPVRAGTVLRPAPELNTDVSSFLVSTVRFPKGLVEFSSLLLVFLTVRRPG